MKKLFLMLGVAALFSLNACGHSGKNVPAKVRSAFTQKFPDATKVKWDQEDENVWEAEFKLEGKEYSANFDNLGLWKETEYEINVSELPTVVKSTLDTEFTGYKIRESEISETTEGKVYEFMLKKEDSKMEVGIGIDGVVLKKEVVSKEDNEDKD